MTINDKQKRIKSLDVRQCAGDAVIDSGREIIDLIVTGKQKL